MGKCIAYTAAAVVFMGLGALIAGICVWYLVPQLEKPTRRIQGIPDFRRAECVAINDDGSNIEMFLRLEQTKSIEQTNSTKSPLRITGNITGVPEGLHGFHIHEWGVPANGDCKGCGGHYNPMRFPHGAPNSTERHVGDLGNINATDGVTEIQITDYVASLWGERSIIGRAFVLHEKEDDLGLNEDIGSKKTGNAGSRLACCTIYLVPE